MPVEVEAEGGDGQVRSKPRARRGSRGGRNRRRKTPAGEVAEGGARPTEDGAPVDPVTREPNTQPDRASGESGYVPMSEWLDDFDR